MPIIAATTVWEDKNASEEEAAEYGYDWHFMAFCSLWRSRTLEYSKAPVIPATNILICFDLQDHQQDDMIKIVRERHSTQSKNDPFHLLQLASSFVMKQFELDLWTFQKPIRNIEKARDNALQRSAKDELLFKRRFKGYTSMHELSRHVIHISESLNVASNNLLAIARDHQDLTPSIRSTNTTKALQLHANMLSNLRLRADAFVERMNNEIGCASNLVSVEILDQTRDDGKSLASTVSVLTLLFLPGTFMSGFFGMNFFDISSDGSSWVVSPQIYVFFICTIPITLLGFLIFILELNMLRWTKNASKPMRDYVHRRFFNAPVKPASQA
ncbi:hypothetical protein ASPWEDRAFT_436777 [Aspergillus wentii DTO 134E9]|uniref:Uncharacterized protein n=1 Tax=Aspergillus wentii DTO 134E9 TaxID=1073089 RepID=A0A1L9RQ13_ASPWE|nr:uncharacterized protein ASPWEDRAFT_436777 [Aspergillus wentii DTO 134E9]OJJ36953.1 hypothetical protein ASPWEDRAFT_436777 [Aspergillus wentii DTO 134E9]